MVVVAVAGDPDVALLVDVNAVLGLRPFVARARPAPAPEQLAVGGELQHRRRRDAAARLGRILLRALLVVDQRRRPVDDPDVVLAVDGDAGDLAEDPFVGQGLGPERINGELGRLGVGLRGDVGTGENEYGNQGCKQQAVHGRSPRYWPSRKCRVGLLWCKPTPKFRMGRIVEYAVAWGTGMPEMHARPRYRRRSGASSRAIDIATLDRRWCWGHVSRRWNKLHPESPWNAV